MTNPAAQLRLFHSGEGTGPRYGSLLVILVVAYLLSALTVADLVSAGLVLLFLAVVLIALRSGRFQRRTVRILAVGLLLGSAASAILRLTDPNGDGDAVANLWTALILLLAVFFVVRQVLSAPQITEQSIYGVLSAYMMIGLIFAAVYVAMWRFSGQSFFVHGGDNTKTFQYFSFTTLTTLGYGDFTAAGDGGRAVAVLEAMIGQMFLATLVARLVAGFRWSDRAASRQASRRAAPAPGTEAARNDSDAGPSLPAEPAFLSAEAPSLSAEAPSLLPGTPTSRPGDPRRGEPSLGQADGGPGTSGPASPGRSRARKAGAAGLVRLSPPGTVRGRATGQRPGGRKGTGGSGQVPSTRPHEQD